MHFVCNVMKLVVFVMQIVSKVYSELFYAIKRLTRFIFKMIPRLFFNLIYQILRRQHWIKIDYSKLFIDKKKNL